MYRKILIPLDGSDESAEVLGPIQEELTRDTGVILLQVIPPAKTRHMGDRVVFGSQQEEAARSRAMGYLRRLVHGAGADPDRWRCEVIIADCVVSGIVDFARSEAVDLIAMYTHDRKGLARLIKGSIAKDVLRRTPIVVKVFKPRELMGVS